MKRLSTRCRMVDKLKLLSENSDEPSQADGSRLPHHSGSRSNGGGHV